MNIDVSYGMTRRLRGLKLGDAKARTIAALQLLLPCNVVLAQDGDDVLVSAASPKALFSVAEKTADLQAIAEDAEQRLRRAIEHV